MLLTYDAIRDLSLLQLAHVSEVPARSATDEEIAAVHDRTFMEAVRGLDEGSVERWAGLEFGLGTPDNPIFSDMHGSSAAVCGATVTAVEAVVGGGVAHAFNPAGGLHHARRSEASGFCVYNDPAVAIAKVLELRPDWRVMYVDIDVHHGDGVQWLFYDEPRVLTVSLHQSGRYLYPGTGAEDEVGQGAARGTSANIPLMPLTGEADYLWAAENTLNELEQAFRPHLLVTQLGADTHHGDPLANLGLTMRAYPRLARLLHDLAHRSAQGRWVATGGGGYQATTVVPKVWTVHFAEMCGAADRVPEEWLRDSPTEEVSQSYRSAVEDSVRRVLQTCVPRLSALAGSQP